ncbi:alkaline phosphatase D family protein [Aureliella helgolandensis]|uniref:Alkaline phosphatase D n=1 Tax=Aureliella helgolandensis TaxID=2527968 RepID=A0A518G8E3_9BACT|nr:alkaline phosphatase D family protein [Aureliella helgolandensis]QDV24862.1 Alkaline phosphatase D precursor [Aureliella helgolandensis]
MIYQRLCFVLLAVPLAVIAPAVRPPVSHGQDAPLRRILFGSCIQQDEPTPIFHTMLETEPQLLLLLGDNIYADTSDNQVMRDKYQRLAKNRAFLELRSSCPLMATWDDHDFGINDGGAAFASRDQAQVAFLDFWDTPLNSPKRAQAGVYDSKIFGPPGKRIQVIMLDTRYFRSPLKVGERRVGGPYEPDDDREKTMLGDMQWHWLERQLREPAELRIIASSIQFVAESAGQEAWANLPHERRRMIDLIQSTGAKGVLFVSGDRHWAELSIERERVPYPLLDATSSSFNQKHPRGTPTKNRFRAVDQTYHHENFGILTIDWDKADPQIKLEIRNIANVAQIQWHIRLSELQP